MQAAVNTNLSYFRIRKIIGYLGFFLPYLVAGVARKWLPSISDYYYSESGVLFTGVLILTGIFLISYRGHQRPEELLTDNLITNIGGFLLLIVAFVPTPYDQGCVDGCHVTPICHCSEAWGAVHFISAAGFFLSMGLLSLFRFTRGTKEGLKDPAKQKRNLVYRTCGVGMIITLVLLAIAFFTIKERLFFGFVYWMEAIMLFFFGISWWVKGKGLVDVGIQEDDPKISESEAKQISDNLIAELTSVQEGETLLKEIEQLSSRRRQEDLNQ